MDSSGRLLVVDDDPSVRAMLVEYLGGHGYDVRAADGGAAMRAEIERDLPDLVLLDIRMPGEDGLTLARFLRERYDVGIIMVTGARATSSTASSASRSAPTTTSPSRSIRASCSRASRACCGGCRRAPRSATAASPARRRRAAAPAARRRAAAACSTSMPRRLFEASGEEVPITAMEFDLLRVFLANPNRVLSRDQLLMQTRNREWEPFDRSIDIRIGRLRKKIEPDPGAEPRCIRTVRNAGYMFVPA